MLLKVRDFLNRYERIFIPIALVLGMVPDILFFAFVSFDLTILALALHLLFAGLSIAVINLYEDKRIRGEFFAFLRSMAPLVLHFTFGALFTAFALFYSFSGSFLVSWPFIVVILFLVIANEVFREYNARPDIHLSVFFFAIFSYFNLAIPYLIRNVGPTIFIGTGILSLLVIGIFVSALIVYLPHVRKVKKLIISSIAGLFIAMNFFYFTNLIPPIPLSVRDIGVYYDVERVEGEYRVLGREMSWLDTLSKFSLAGEEFHTYDTSEAFVFSAVFAPPGMDLEIVHEWQFKEASGEWVTLSTLSFPITGGREAGFRGFSKTQHIKPGNWRVNVKTNRGQIVTRYRFEVVEVNSPPVYKLEVK